MADVLAFVRKALPARRTAPGPPLDPAEAARTIAWLAQRVVDSDDRAARYAEAAAVLFELVIARNKAQGFTDPDLERSIVMARADVAALRANAATLQQLLQDAGAAELAHPPPTPA